MSAHRPVRHLSPLEAPDGTLTVRNAAARAGITEHHVRLLVLAGRLRCTAPPDPSRISRWRVYARDVQNYIDARELKELDEDDNSEVAPLLWRGPNPAALPQLVAA